MNENENVSKNKSDVLHKTIHVVIANGNKN